MFGKASLEVTTNFNYVQISNFGDNSFKINNTGDKNIASVAIDVTNALYPDSVFDPFGLAGDTTSKKLSIDTNGGTGIIAPSNASYIGTGGRDGYRRIELNFDDAVNGGFESGETVGFSVDMDPNSVAGTNKGSLDSGSSPNWDVGGVSGAELIGSEFIVTFTDGTTAIGQLQGNDSQGGSQALANQNSSNLAVDLKVNGLNEGSVGTYDADAPQVIINGAAGETARIVLTKGFIQPVSSYANFLTERLDLLAESDFPANNAVEFQTVDVQLTGTNQDISNLFDFNNVAQYNFAGDDRLPLGFVASIIDVDNNDFALGGVTQPIYLQYSDADIDIDVDPNPVDNDSDPVVVIDVDPNPVDNEPDLEVVNDPEDTPVATDKIIVEAEDMQDLVGYRLENNSLASGDRLLSLVGGSQNETGSASFDFTGVSGNYSITLGTYDESDGNAIIQVAQEGNIIGSVLLDDNSGSNAISSNTQVAKSITTSAAIAQGDNFTITGFENNGEHARFDYIEFELISAVEPSEPNEPEAEDPVIDTQEEPIISPEDLNSPDDDAPGDVDVDMPTEAIRFEAEDADIINNYRQESISGASSGKVLSFVAGNYNESGSASFTFNEPAGIYDVVLAAYDENDGQANLEVSLNNNAIADLVLDRNLGSSGGNAQTAMTETVAIGISLAPGDVLTISAFENVNEHARFDYIEFVPQSI